MPVLESGKTVRSRTPTLLVENKFDPGAYRFRLVVIDDESHPSAPADLIVTVLAAPQPISPSRTTIRTTSPRSRRGGGARRRPPQ